MQQERATIVCECHEKEQQSFVNDLSSGLNVIRASSASALKFVALNQVFHGHGVHT